MKRKRLLISLIVAAYLVAVLLCVAYTFTLRKIDVTYSSFDNKSNANIEQDLNSYVGKNLLFLDVAEVELSLAKFTDYKVLSVEKSFPDNLKIKLMQRQPMFVLNLQDKAVVLDNEAVVLKNSETSVENRNLIQIKFDTSKDFNNLSCVSAEVGQKVVTSDDELFSAVLNMASKINYYNCITEILIQKGAIPEANAVFSTYTGVDFKILNVMVKGEEKIDAVFNAYDKEDSDYIKSFDTIIGSLNTTDNTITVTWTSRDGNEE